MGRMIVPPGFRFHPTDEELIHDYLERKVVSRPLPIPIPTLDVYSTPPEALLPAAFHGTDGNYYCFAHTSPCSKKGGGRFKRAVGLAGTWNSNRNSKIVAGGGVVIIGYRKSLSFQAPAVAKGGRKESTGWVMEEYRLAEGTGAAFEVRDLVLCKIRNRKEDALASAERIMEGDINATSEEFLGLEEEMVTMIPVGFRFDPSERELLCYYLKRKMDGQPLPLAIPTLEVYDAAPWELPPGLGGVDGHFFCFARRSRRSNTGERVKRAVGTLGTWYDNRDKEVVVGGELVGYNTFLSFQTPGSDDGRKPKNTGWVMHEYRLAGSKGTSEFQGTVLCKIRNWKQVDGFTTCGKRKREPFEEDGVLLLEVGETNIGTTCWQDDAAVDPVGCLPSSTLPASPQLLPMASWSPTVSLSGITWEDNNEEGSMTGVTSRDAPWLLASHGLTAAASTWDPPWDEASTPCVLQAGSSTTDMTFAATVGAASMDGGEAGTLLLENHACTSDGELAACCSTSAGACPLPVDAASMAVPDLCEPAPGGDEIIFSMAEVEEMLKLLNVELDSAGVAQLLGEHTGQMGYYSAMPLESSDQMVTEQPAPLQLIPDGLQQQQQQQQQQPAPLPLIPHGMQQEQAQNEGVIDPAHMSNRVRKLWKRLLKCMAASPVEVAEEVEMIPGSELYDDGLDWGLLGRNTNL